MEHKQAEWIAVDWGTTHMRAFVFGAEDALLARLASDKGMGALRPEDFEPVLLDIVRPYLGSGPIPVICCGMVGARQGWREAAYAAVPCAPPNATTGLVVDATDARIAPRILPGVMQKSPADVMRGEETQIAGYLAEDADFDGVICLPGTHTKWAHISAGEIVSFRTFMTGELFALLSQQSVLRHGVTGEDWDAAAFDDAVSDAMSKPQAFAARLFGLRAEMLVNDMGQGTAKARLSGLLIGLELAGSRPYWLGQRIALVGDPGLSSLYQTALEQQGIMAETADGDQMTLAGLRAAYAVTKDT